ncbi:MAG: type 4a pilus biogenesis protein PilO [Acidobacteria bacterium]|nr:type 4a pilus biogenesis protein PilO [Acidobacteriota bacterium]
MADAKGNNFLAGVPWFVQFIGIILIGVIIGYGGSNFLFADTREETRKKQEELNKLREDNRKGAIVRDNLKSYQKRYDDAQAELKVLRDFLPEDVEISRVLENIQQQATEQKLTLKVFIGRDLQKKDFYKEKPVNIQVSGLYNSLGKFFQQIATYRRIVSVSDVEIKKANPQTLNHDIDASFTVTAYVASEQDVSNVSAPADDKGGQK